MEHQERRIVAALRRGWGFPLVAMAIASAGRLPAQVATGGQTAKPGAFLAQVDQHFDSWDLDHNGELSRDEIDRAIADPATKGEAAAAIVALKRATMSKALKLAPLTRAAIASYAATLARRGTAGPNFNRLYVAALRRISTASRTIFASGTPNLEMLHQGRLGDCFVLAPLGAMIARDPLDVVRMFGLSGDGMITVTLGTSPPVEIKPLTDAEIALSSTASDNGIWVNIYEKAVGERAVEANAARAGATAAQGGTPELGSTDSVDLPLDAISSGGKTARIMSLITGHRVRTLSCSPWRVPPPIRDLAHPSAAMSTAPSGGRRPLVDKQARLTLLRKLLSESLNGSPKRLVCAATPSGERRVPGITMRHAYGVFDYDPATDQVTLWNPHGNTFHPKGEPGRLNGYPTVAGRFTAPLTDVITIYASFMFETDRPAK